MLIKTYSAAVNGLEVTTVTIEVSITNGIMYHFTGLGDTAVREGRDRIAAAMRFNGFRFPHADITVNMAPADLRKEGSGFDLPLAIAILAANGTIQSDLLDKYMIVGELGLDGRLQPIKGALPIAIKAHKDNFRGVIVPKENVMEAAVVSGLEVYGMETMSEVIGFLVGANKPFYGRDFEKSKNDAANNPGSQPKADQSSDIAFTPTVVDTHKLFYEGQYHFDLDFADVRGQESVRRALEVAAAGGHNLIMVGPPGSGKSMMAKRLPSILPPLSMAESLETTQIHSVAGKMKKNATLITQRPFRAPHHTISEVALVGGGNNPTPGEISLAHNGVLFLDELPEFNKSTLELLRQPLEDRHITISRSKYTTDYPTSFMFVASMNPCPCGYHGDKTHQCVCTPGQRHHYMSKISGPLMDRIDIQCEISALPFKDISKVQPGEPSAAIRERVIAARRIQTERYKDSKLIHCNAQMTDRMIHQYCVLDQQALNILQAAMERLSLSARAYSRILKVARTIADLEGKENIEMHHVAEAVGYRSLDRGDWAER